MGYAGYTPAKLPPAKPTEVEAAVQSIKSMDSLEVIGKLLYNCAVSPREEKYRRIKLSNKKISETIVNTPGALDAMQALGWVQDEANLEELMLPAGVFMTMKEVRIVEDAKDKLKKNMRSASNKNLPSMVSVQA